MIIELSPAIVKLSAIIDFTDKFGLFKMKLLNVSTQMHFSSEIFLAVLTNVLRVVLLFSVS